MNNLRSSRVTRTLVRGLREPETARIESWLSQKIKTWEIRGWEAWSLRSTFRQEPRANSSALLLVPMPRLEPQSTTKPGFWTKIEAPPPLGPGLGEAEPSVYAMAVSGPELFNRSK